MKKQSNLSILLSYAGNHKFLTYASWILSAISALLALVPFLYIWRIISEILNTSSDFAYSKSLTHYGWMAVLFAVISILVYISALMCSHISAFRVAANIRIKAMAHIVKMPLGAAEKFGSGKLRKIVNESSAATENYLAHQLPDKWGAIATPVGLLALLFVFDWRLGLLSLIPVILGFLIMMSMTGSKMLQKMKEYQNALDDMSNEAVEYVRGIPVVKTFGQTIFTFKKFKNSIDSYKTWVIAYTKQLRLPMLFYTTAINSVFAFLIAAAFFFAHSGATYEFLLNLIFYIVITPVISLTLTRIMFQSENEMIVDDALSRINAIFNTAPLSQAEKPAEPLDASVRLENVTFSYDGMNNALENVSLTIPQGKTVAFVGPSGGGKSTIANIITRFFDPDSGKVIIGGVDVKDIQKEQLMNTVSFVFQNSRLLKASILDNILIGNPKATHEMVINALRAAQCEDIIEKFPKGIDTVIGSKGVYLSSGEQQRIAIARAVIKNAPIVIFDEATAFADPDNERKVQKALSELSKGKTVIMIAHRLSAVAKTDMIYVLKDGSIIEEGSFEQLIALQGFFEAMWKEYQTSLDWKVEKEEAKND